MIRTGLCIFGMFFRRKIGVNALLHPSVYYQGDTSQSNQRFLFFSVCKLGSGVRFDAKLIHEKVMLEILSNHRSAYTNLKLRSLSISFSDLIDFCGQNYRN